MLYAWCPLAIKEISFTAHPDIVGIALLLGAFHLARMRPAVAVVLAALACTTKIFALLLLPFLLHRMAFRYWILWAASVAALYAPFILQGASDLGVLGVFYRQWEFNATLFAWVSTFVDDRHAKLICYALFCAWWGFYWRRDMRTKSKIFPRGEWIVGLFLFAAPVLNAWYLIWLLPFAALTDARRQVWPWVLATVAPLSYLVGLHYPLPDLHPYRIVWWAYYAQIGAVAAAIVFDGLRHIRKSSS